MRRARLKRRRILPVRLRGETNAPVCLGNDLVETRGRELRVDDEIASVVSNPDARP